MSFSNNRRVILISIVAIFLFIFPLVTRADDLCASDGYTIVLVNGILTTDQEAKDELRQFKKLANKTGNPEIDVELGYNPTHLNGWGDKVESLAQAFNKSISDFDLDTILMQMHDEVHTQKLLLVGHSQGTFYTNEIYKYLVTHGVSPDSVAVYNIATPASTVAGAGKYMTSTNDKAINWIRDHETNSNVDLALESRGAIGGVVASPLRGNITIPKEAGWDTDNFGGHHFSVYMNGAGDRVVSEINMALSKLKPSGNSEDCFEIPRADLKYHMQAAAFTVADPIVNAAATVVDPVVDTVWSGTKTALSAIGFAIGNGSSHLSNAAIGAFLSDSLNSGLSAILSTRGAFAGVNTNGDQTAAAAASDSSIELAPSSTANQNPMVEPVTSAKTISAIPSSSAQASAAPPQNPPPAAKAPTPPAPVSEPTQSLFSVQPGFGGGGGGAAPNNTIAVSSTPSVPAVTFSISAPFDNAYLATTSVTFSGTADAGASVTLSESSELASTTVDATGVWSLSSVFSEGTHALSLLSSLAGHTDTTERRSITIDTQAPGTTTVSIAACAQSIASGFCALPTVSADVSWTAATDADHYGVAVNGVVVATTTALMVSAPLADNATNTIAVVSYDIAGNTATSSNTDVYAISRPLIINEIGWGGDLGFTTDIVRHSNQWVELKSLSPFTLDLTRFEFDSSGNAPISLTGTLSPGDPYAGLEVTDMGVPAQRQVAVFTLATTSAEKLSLAWNGAPIDATPDAGTCATWCAGAYEATLGQNVSGRSPMVTPLSMERVSDSSDGALAGSWRSADSYDTYWGSLADANAHNYPDAGVYCGSPDDVLQDDRTFTLAAPGRSILCTFLARFITPGTFGATRYNELYRGATGSSTLVYASLAGSAIAHLGFVQVPADASPGEQFFFAIFEVRPFGNDVADFKHFFEQSASTTFGYTAPHGNYVVLPFTYQP